MALPLSVRENKESTRVVLSDLVRLKKLTNNLIGRALNFFSDLKSDLRFEKAQVSNVQN